MLSSFIYNSDTEIVWQSLRRTLRSRQSRHARSRLPSASSFLVSLRSTPSQKAPSPSPRFVPHHLHPHTRVLTRHAAVLERRSQVSAFALLGPRWCVYVDDVEVVFVARGRRGRDSVGASTLLYPCLCGRALRAALYCMIPSLTFCLSSRLCSSLSTVPLEWIHHASCTLWVSV